MTKNKMTIPEVRERLRELAEQHGIDELNFLADQMYREYANGRAPTRSPTVTAEVANEIRAFAKANPDAHQQDIAEHFGVNHGRVSEALSGDR